METKIAVILPTINRPSLIGAIESVRQQRYTAWTLYIIGDGMLPNIPNYNDIRIQIASTGQTYNDSGATPRNHGINISNESIIAYLDDDDLYYPDHLSTIVELHERDPVANIFKTGAQEMKWVHKSPRHKERVLKLRGINTTDPLTITLAHSRELFKKTTGWQPCDNHDHKLFNEMLAAGGVLAKTEHVTTLFLR